MVAGARGIRNRSATGSDGGGQAWGAGQRVRDRVPADRMASAPRRADRDHPRRGRGAAAQHGDAHDLAARRGGDRCGVDAATLEPSPQPNLQRVDRDARGSGETGLLQQHLTVAQRQRVQERRRILGAVGVGRPVRGEVHQEPLGVAQGGGGQSAREDDAVRRLVGGEVVPNPAVRPGTPRVNDDACAPRQGQHVVVVQPRSLDLDAGQGEGRLEGWVVQDHVRARQVVCRSPPDLGVIHARSHHGRGEVAQLVRPHSERGSPHGIGVGIHREHLQARAGAGRREGPACRAQAHDRDIEHPVTLAPRHVQGGWVAMPITPSVGT